MSLSVSWFLNSTSKAWWSQRHAERGKGHASLFPPKKIEMKDKGDVPPLLVLFQRPGERERRFFPFFFHSLSILFFSIAFFFLFFFLLFQCLLPNSLLYPLPRAHARACHSLPRERAKGPREEHARALALSRALSPVSRSDGKKKDDK